MAELDVAEDRAAQRALIDHDERIEAIEQALAKHPRRKQLAAWVTLDHWALLVCVWVNLALVLWWAVISCGMGMSPIAGGPVCGIAVCAAVIVSAWTIGEAVDLRREETRR